MNCFSYLLAVSALALVSGPTLAATPIAVGTNTCLFLDDHFIAEQTGLKRTFHQGQPHPQAVIAETEPWEHWICLYGGCFYDPVANVYRLYYQNTPNQPASGEPGISMRQDVCYAESKDAIHWVKPKLGLVDYKGSKANNILFYCAGPANAFIDPLATNANGRIKANVYFLKKDPRYGDGHGMQVLQSPDGLHWEHVNFMAGPVFANPGEGGFVDMAVYGWDSIRNKYLCNWRLFSQHTIAEKPNGKRRAIGISWSDQLHRNWSPAIRIVSADSRDDQHAARLGKDPAKPDHTELYTMPIMTYGNHYLGFVTLFELGDGLDFNGGGGLHLAFSNDGLHWSRSEPRQNAIANSDDPELFPNFAQFNPMLQMGDEVWLFYSENNGTHGVQPFGKSRGRIRAAVWRKDGFASLDAAADAMLTTKPMTPGGNELIVNYQTEPGGSLRIAVLDADGNPVSQFNLGECQPLQGDATSKKIEWVGGTDFSKRGGDKPVRLMFELTKAKLYSFRFQ